jgi:hypothetical protein
MAKKRSSRRRKHNALFGGSHRRRRHNPGIRRHFRRHNPLPLATNEILPTVGGAVVGGIAASTIPGFLPAAFSAGFLKYIASGAVAVGGSMALQKYRSIALGFLVGGLTVTFGEIFDDFFGKQIVSFQSPVNVGISSYYKQGYVPLPGTTDRVPFALPPAPVASVRAGSASAAKGVSGMGWNPRFSSRFAA